MSVPDERYSKNVSCTIRFLFFVNDKMVELYLNNIFVCLHGILSTFSNLLHTEHYRLYDVAI